MNSVPHPFPDGPSVQEQPFAARVCLAFLDLTRRPLSYISIRAVSPVLTGPGSPLLPGHISPAFKAHLECCPGGEAFPSTANGEQAIPLVFSIALGHNVLSAKS